MDPCPFVRVLVGNLALKMPATSSSAPRAPGAGVHPATTSPCHCRIRLDKLPYQLATAPLLPSTTAVDQPPAPCNTGAFAAAFHLSRATTATTAFAKKPAALFGGARRVARLKVAVYAGQSGTTSCGGVASGMRLLGKVVIPLDLKAAAEGKPVVFHSGWVAIGKRHRRGGRKSSSSSSSTTAAAIASGQQQQAQLNLTVRAEPDPRFVFEFDGEPECSPQVLQVQGSMKQPVFTCKFSCRSNSDLRSRSVHSDPGGVTVFVGGGASSGSGGARGWLAKLGSDRERAAGRKERKGWSVTVHDLSGSPVALASMVTPFVASPGSDRVSRSNPGAWLILRPGDGTWKPWGRLECWRERNGGGDCLGYRFELVVPETTSGMGVAVCVAESGVPAGKGGRFAIDLTAAQPFGSGDQQQLLHGGAWPFGSFRGFVMSAAVQGEGRRCSSRGPAVEVGVAHVGCAEDAAAFVALAAAVDLSVDACRLFSCKLRRELSGDLPLLR